MRKGKDSKKNYAFALILILFSIALRFYLVNINKGPLSGLMWDEYIFISAARNLKDGFGYTSDRPPFLPALIALIFQVFGENLTIVKYVIPALASIAILSVYFLASSLYNKTVGIVSSILISSLPVYLFLSTRILTEVPFFLFFTLSLASFYLAMEKNRKYFFLVGVFTALSLLSRYTGIVLFFIYFAYIVFTKKMKVFFDRNLWLALILFFVVLLPWLLINFETMGNPLGPLIENLRINRNIKTVEAINLPLIGFKLDFPPSLYYLLVLPLVGSILFFITILYFFFYRKIGKEELLLLLSFFVILITHLILVGRASIRFLNELGIAFSIFSALFLLKTFKSKLLFAVIFSLWVLNLLLGISSVAWYSNNREILENPNYELYMKTWNYLKDNVTKDSTILTNLEPVVTDTGQYAISIIFNENSFKEQLKYADYVLVSRNEPTWDEIRFIENERSLVPIYTIDGIVILYKVLHS